MPAHPVKPAEPIPPPKKDEKPASASPAKLIVEVPADAKLFIDDQLMKTSSDRRVFNTPALQQGQTYYYMVRAEIVRDGQPITETKRVLIHAGETTQASFTSMARATTTTETAADASRR